MRRVIVLSLSILMTVGESGIALPDSIDHYGLYNAPSSGCLGTALTRPDMASVSLRFGPVPDGRLGPSTTSFEKPDSVSRAVQEDAALQFNDRWSFDNRPSENPHRPQTYARQRHRVQSLWTLMGL